MMNPHAGMQMHPSMGLMPQAQAPQAPQGPMGTFNNPFTISGILDDPSQLQNLNQNPLFNMGMGLLAHRYDADVNPFQAMVGGLQTSQKFQTEADERARLEEQQKMLTDFFEEQKKALEQSRQGQRQSSVFETAVSPSVRRGLGAAALTGQNQDLYKRMALREILGQ